MACDKDKQIFSELKRLGFDPGPVTEMTRGIYEKKLNQLKSKSTANSVGTSKADDSTKGVKDTSRQTTRLLHNNATDSSQTQSPSGETAGSTARSRDDGDTDKKFLLPLTPTSPSPPSPETSRSLLVFPPLAGPSVVSKLLLSLNCVHMASDTAFLFPSGDMFLASRSILSTQCQDLIPLLYNREEPFSVNVATKTGHMARFFVRPNELVVDLKQKVSLSEALSVEEQQLFLNDVELMNGMAIHQAGIGPRATLKLVLNSENSKNTNTTYFTSSVAPSLSIYHCNLRLGMEHIIPMGVVSPKLLPPRVPLPRHLLHIVHMYDVPYLAWAAFVYFLYSQHLHSDMSLEVTICCWVLAKKFSVPDLSQLTLSIIQHQLTSDNAGPLYHYATLINANPLKEICQPFLHSTANSR